MIPHATPTNEVEQNFTPIKSFDMDITSNPEMRAELIRGLVNKYTDPLAAVIREYSTNARDAHIEAGNDAPIEVHTPSEMGQPCLIIKDKGVGLDADGLGLFFTVGESSKLKTNEQTGRFGLGCKSGLAITQQFSIVSVKDGKKYTSILGENVAGAYTLDILKVVDTDEENGVTISIPVESHRYAETLNKARDFFYTWPKGTVLLNGSEPASITDEDSYMKFGDHAIVRARVNGRSGSVFARMGSVLYQVQTHNLPEYGYGKAHSFDNSYNVVLEAPMGTLNIVPSRDDLLYDTRTTENLTAFIEEINQAAHDTMVEEFAHVTSFEDGFKKVMDWKEISPGLFGKGHEAYEDMTFKGVPFSEDIVTGPTRRGYAITANLSGGKTRFEGKHQSLRRIWFAQPSMMKDTHVYIAFDHAEQGRAVAGVKDYMNATGAESITMFFGAFEDNPWITENPMFTYVSSEEFFGVVSGERKRKTQERNARRKAENGGVPAKAKPVTYEVYADGDLISMSIQDVKGITGQVYYAQDDAFDVTYKAFGKLGKDDITFINLGKGRKLSALENRMKNATLVPVSELVKTLLSEAFENERWINLYVVSRSVSSYRSLHEILKGLSYAWGIYRAKLEKAKVTYPTGISEAMTTLREAAEVEQTFNMLSRAASYNYVGHQDINAFATRERTTAALTELGLDEFTDEKLCERYPMLTVVGRRQTRNIEELAVIVDYMNMMDAQKK